MLPNDADVEHDRSFLVSHNYAISARLVNEFRFRWADRRGIRYTRGFLLIPRGNRETTYEQGQMSRDLERVLVLAKEATARSCLWRTLDTRPL
jgi:hypothetical protein